MALGTAPDLASILQAVQDRMRVGSGPLPQWGGYQAPALPTRPVGNLSSWDRLWQPAQIPATNTVTLPHRIPGATMRAPDPFPMTPSAEPLPSWSGYTPPVRVNPVQLPQGVGVNEAQIGNLRPITSANMEIPPLASSAFNNPMSIPQGAGVGANSPSLSGLYGSNPYAEAAGVSPGSIPASTPGIYNFPGAATSAPVVGGDNFLNSGALGSDVGGLASKSFGKWGNIGAAIGIPLAGQAVASHLSDPAQAGAVRGISNVAGQGSWAVPMMAGQLGISGVGTLPAIGAAAAGAGLAQGFSATGVGNATINQMRGQGPGDLHYDEQGRLRVDKDGNPVKDIGLKDYAAAAIQPMFGALPLVGRAAEKLGFLSGSTNDTVGDVLGGGSDTAAKSQAAPVVTPEQRMAQTSPDSLAKIATDYGLSDAMKQKLIKNYNQAMVMAKTQGAVSLPVDKDGKIDGMDAKDYPGAKQITDAKGNTQWVSTNPADIQQSVFEQATQLIPSLGHAQEQEDDFFRKQAVMQSQLEAAMPMLYDAPSWQGDPYAKQLAMTEARAIPSRYVQAQALQAQQAYDNQIAQAMQQQQLAAQYPDLFGKKNSSSTPTTLDAAMAQ